MEFTARFSGANEVWATAWPSRMNTDAAGYIASWTAWHRNIFYDCTEFQETSAMFFSMEEHARNSPQWRVGVGKTLRLPRS
jgi:hypothetical protein